jgi:hypothetical protein
MYHNTAPPISSDDHYNQVVPISNFADVGDRKDHASQIKMSSFHNSVAANHQEERPKPPHSAFISVQMMKAKAGAPAAESRRCRLPSNEFSHDFMMKMKKGDQSPNQPDLKDIMGNFLSLIEEERDQTEFAFD